MMPPCCFTPSASPFRTIGTVTSKLLVHRDTLQVDVQQLALDRFVLPVDDHRLGRSPPSRARSKIVLCPLSEFRMRVTCRGSTAIGRRVLAAPYTTAGIFAANSNAARRILGTRFPGLRFENVVALLPLP